MDTSVLVAVFTPDSFSLQADAFLRRGAVLPFVSDFAVTEFASVIARRVRIREFSQDQARAIFSSFDVWAARLGPRVQTKASDVIGSEALLRRLDLPLRTPDALHIAIVQRLGVTLATFDEQLGKSAIALGLPVAAL